MRLRPLLTVIRVREIVINRINRLIVIRAVTAGHLIINVRCRAVNANECRRTVINGQTN